MSAYKYVHWHTVLLASALRTLSQSVKKLNPDDGCFQVRMLIAGDSKEAVAEQSQKAESDADHPDMGWTLFEVCAASKRLQAYRLIHSLILLAHPGCLHCLAEAQDLPACIHGGRGSFSEWAVLTLAISG